jgi:arginyl-tRNA synthetase
MPTLLDSLSQTVGAVFAAQELPAELGLTRVSDRPDLAQFQCNGAMAAAKKLGKNPREIAATLVDEIIKEAKYGNMPLFTKVEAVGPGFINLNINDAVISQFLGDLKKDPHLSVPQTGTGQTVLLDYGGPNAAKPMHVGHLRSGIVGDTLRRLFVTCGYTALGDIHLGDSGLQAGMVISEFQIRHPEWAYFTGSGPFPATPPFTFEELSEIYPTASTNAKADETRMEIAQRATLELEQGHKGYNALWDQVIELSIDAMKANYARLNVHFDLWNGERTVLSLVPTMVADLKAKHFAVESDGAIVIPVARNDDKKEMPPLILVKRDGASLYATTDLATLIDRMNMKPAPDKIVYVIDQRQGLHIEQVKRAATMAKIIPDENMIEFAGFGTMNGLDGKPFKTRAGGVLRLEDLITQGIEKARDRLQKAGVQDHVDAAEFNDIAQKVAVAAIKYADLKNPRHVDYIFDLDAMTAFEGKTGPYLLYQTVRIKSILKKLTEQNLSVTSGYEPQVSDESRALGLLLLDFPNAITASVDNLSAHILCDYLHRLAQEFASFYARCHILSETDINRQQSWVELCKLTERVLTHGLRLMGIDVPDRM